MSHLVVQLFVPRLLVNTLQGVTFFPSSPIQQNGHALFVYVIQNNIAHMRSIQAGVANGGLTQVTGVGPGDVVANSGFDKLPENSAVVISTKPVPPSTTTQPGNGC